jgi:hypothetical protein
MGLMDAGIRARFERYAKSPTTWNPVSGGRRLLVAWDDDITEDLGPDPDRSRFSQIADLMTSGRYYPADVIVFHRLHEGPMTPGERVLQQTALLGIPLWSMVEIFLAERTETICRIGYVTTAKHHGRGIWQAHLTWEVGQLSLRVFSTAGPQSIWFWLGLPIARFLQLRARRKALERFKSLS